MVNTKCLRPPFQSQAKQGGGLIRDETPPQKYYAHHLNLIFGGIDGAAPKLGAWRLIQFISRGTQKTVFHDAKFATDIPFFSGSGLKEHNLQLRVSSSWSSGGHPF